MPGDSRHKCYLGQRGVSSYLRLIDIPTPHSESLFTLSPSDLIQRLEGIEVLAVFSNAKLTSSKLHPFDSMHESC